MFRLCIFYVSLMFHVQFYQLLSGISNVTVLFRFQVNSLKTAASLGSMCRASCSHQLVHNNQLRTTVQLRLLLLHHRPARLECIATVPLLTSKMFYTLQSYRYLTIIYFQFGIGRRGQRGNLTGQLWSIYSLHCRCFNCGGAAFASWVDEDGRRRRQTGLYYTQLLWMLICWYMNLWNYLLAL